jgi:hypothetical protein
MSSILEAIQPLELRFQAAFASENGGVFFVAADSRYQQKTHAKDIDMGFFRLSLARISHDRINKNG